MSNDNLSPFDFVNSVSTTKKDLVRSNPDLTPEQAEKQYNPFIVNRALSMWPDTILHANEMNRLPDMFKDAQYRYYLNVLRSSKRFSKWAKTEKNNDIEMLQVVYGCNRRVAKYYLKILTKEQLEEVRKSREIGGTSSNIK
jgi:hypothetical protein